MTHQAEQDREQPGRPRRRAYHAPAVVESAQFETLAASCGKTVGQGICDNILGATAS